MNYILKYLCAITVCFAVRAVEFKHPFNWQDNDIPTRTVVHDDWAYAVAEAENAVVQIISQGAQYNWTQPFKAPDQMQSAGTGFIIENGYVLTNYHVISEGMSAYGFVPALGRDYLNLQVIGCCPEADIALLQIEPESLQLLKKAIGRIPVLKLGNSDNLYHTEPVLAIGYPHANRYLKTTLGEIAGREYRNGRSYMHITAPINEGNSGGPLLNKQGEVIGINTAIIRNSQNICFMVPSNDMNILLDDLKNNILLFKARLGVRFNTSTPDHAVYLRNPAPSGLYINYVNSGSNAERIGLKAGDMLYQINGYNIDHYGDAQVDLPSAPKISFGELLNRFAVNQHIELLVYRNGQKIYLSGALEKTNLMPIRYIYPELEPKEMDYELFGGMCIMQLRANHFEYLRGPNLELYQRQDHEDKEVLVITNILPGSVIDRVHCFAPGLLLESVNEENVRTLPQLRSALKKSLKTGSIAITCKEKYATVISLDKLVHAESILAQNYKFEITPAMAELIEATK